MCTFTRVKYHGKTWRACLPQRRLKNQAWRSESGKKWQDDNMLRQNIIRRFYWRVILSCCGKGLFGYEIPMGIFVSMEYVYRLKDCVLVSDGSQCRARKILGGIARKSRPWHIVRTLVVMTVLWIDIESVLRADETKLLRDVYGDSVDKIVQGVL